MANVTETTLSTVDNVTQFTGITIPAGKLGFLLIETPSDTATFSGFTDGAGNVWSVSVQKNTAGDVITNAIFYCVLVSPLSAATLTPGLSAGNFAGTCGYLDSDTGWLAQASVLDKVASAATAFGAPFSSGNTAVTTQADEAVLGIAGNGGGSALLNAAGYTTITDQNAVGIGRRVTSAWKKVTATGAQAFAGNWAASDSGPVCVATFKTAAAAAAPATPFRPLLPRLEAFNPLRSPFLGFPAPAATATPTTPVSNSAVVPYESLGAATQTGDEPSESTGPASTTSTFPLEAAQGVAQVGNPDPVEAAQGVATTAADPLEATGAVAASGQLPYEEVQALAGQQAVLPTEAAQGITATGSADPLEAGQGITQTGVDPLESAGGVVSTRSDPYESAAPASTTASAPYEAAQGVTATGGTDPVESAGGVAQTGTEPLEALGGVASTSGDPYESLQAGVTPVSQALAFAFEALGVATSAPTLPLEALMGGIVQTAADAIEALGGLLASAIEAVESALGLSTSATDPVEVFRGIAQTGSEPTEAAGGVASSPVLPLESIQQFAGKTAILPFESFLGAGTATASLPYDVLGALLAGGILPIEALGFIPIPPAPADGGPGGIIGDMGGPEHSRPLRKGDRRLDDDEELVNVLRLLDLL